MKHDYAQKMDRFWVIDAFKKGPILKKVNFYFFVKLIDFCTLFFCYSTTFFESPITHKRFIFEESHISYGKRQKSCTLIVI